MKDPRSWTVCWSYSSVFLSVCATLMLPYLLVSIALYYYFYGFEHMYVFPVLLSSSLIPLFVSVGMFVSLTVEDRFTGLLVALLVWLFLAGLYDAFILYLAILLSEYPVESVVILLTMLNPIDTKHRSFRAPELCG